MVKITVQKNDLHLGLVTVKMTYNTIQYNTIQYNTMQCNAMQCNAMQYNAMQCNAMQYNAIQYNTIQYNTLLTTPQQRLFSDNFTILNSYCIVSHKSFWPSHNDLGHSVQFFLQFDLDSDQMTIDLAWFARNYLWLGLLTCKKWLVAWHDLQEMTCNLAWLARNDLWHDLDSDQMICDVAWLVHWLGRAKKDYSTYFITELVTVPTLW
jgi:hypothetical protein